MKKLLKFTVCLALLVMVVVLFTGCKVTGGGSFINDLPCSDNEKCTFGFVAQGTETDGDWAYKGQFQFNDHAGYKFHISNMQLLTVFGPVADFAGVTKGGDIVNVTVTDMGESGAGPGDYILVVVPGEGAWGGAVQGEIKIH